MPPTGTSPLFDVAEADSSSDSDPGVDLPQSEPEKDIDWKDLITSEEEIDKKFADGTGQRVGENRCVQIVIEGWPTTGSLPSEKELRDTLQCQEGHVFNYQDVADDRRQLQMQFDDYFAGLKVYVEPVDEKSNHYKVIYKFQPATYERIQEVDIQGAALMPDSIKDKIKSQCTPDNPVRVDIGVMDKVRNAIESWYQDRGLPFCYVGYFDGMEQGTLRAHVIEAKVDSVKVRFIKEKDMPDEEWTSASEGDILSADKIIEASGIRKGEIYHIDDSYDALSNVYALGLVDEANIEPVQDPKDPSKIQIRIQVQEIQPKSMEMELDWAFELQDNGLPRLNRQSLIPGGSVELTHCNLFGDAQFLSVSMSSSDWRNPAQDLGFELSYTEPIWKPNRDRNVQVFTTRKMSPVFTAGGEGEVPPIFVDRFGAKAWSTYLGGNDTVVEQALMLQRITTTDENGAPTTKGTKVSRGYYADNGPQTTLSETGRDVSASYQAYCAIDSVQFVNGNQLGQRMAFQMDQGLNLKVPLPGGRSFGLSGGLFNRALASYTNFVQIPGLRKLSQEDVWLKRKAPNTLVLHARLGNCIGDMASYDYFTLGGPYSVRGYSYGELGACRRFLETAAEVRFPLKNYNLPATAYAFAEMGTDLGSSNTLTGNPTEYYRKAGRGMSLGVGLKALGACRFEYARDCNAGTGSFFVNWGERF